MRNDIIRRGLSGLLSGVMLIGLLPTAAFAAAPTDHNYQATEYKNQEPGVDENMEPGSDLNIYVSIDMSDGDEQIYSVHTCSDPQVSTPEISQATQDSPGLITYSCGTCGAYAEVEIPQLDDDALVSDGDTGLKANGVDWERWLGPDSYGSTVEGGEYIVRIQNRMFDAEYDLGPVGANDGIMLASNSATDDPTQWPASATKDVVQNTTPGNEPVYLFVDYEHPDSENHAIKAAHKCKEGASLVDESYKATSSADGLIKFTCDQCGSSAELTIPALTLDAFTLTPESQTDIENGVTYSGDEYTIAYDVASQYRRFIGTELNNNVHITDCGSYHVIITISNGCYDNVQLDGTDILTVRPKPVTPPSTDMFANKVYDGTSILDGKSFSYEDVNGEDISVPMTVYAVSFNGSQLSVDESTRVSDASPAGVYAITFQITDKNYCWDVEDAEPGKVYTKYSLITHVLPKANPIYVGDAESSITLQSGNSELYSVSVVAGQGGFDSSHPGETSTTVQFNRKDGSWNNARLNVSPVPVEVQSREIYKVTGVTATKPIGTEFSNLELPTTITVSAEGDYQATVPVLWDSSSYDPKTVSQTVYGTLDLSGHPELNNDGNIRAEATVNLTKGSVSAPTFTAFSKVYDGNSDALQLPATTEGIASMSVRYTGTSTAGSAYSSDAAPVNAGTYKATVSFTMEPGYEQLAAVEVDYTISKATQTCPAPTLASSTTTSITLTAVPGALYSKDGSVWSESPEFTNLGPGREYTFYQKLAATEDGNYEESPVVTAQFSTTQEQIDTPDLQAQTATYTGSPISYRVSPITGVAKSTVEYYVNDEWVSTAPTNAGTYPVRVTFTMNSGVAQLDPVETTLTINKADRQAPPAPTSSNVGMTSISVTTIQGAVYSINGTTWQPSPLFEGLTPSTDYTVYAKYPADDNHNESPASSAVIRTSNQSTSAGTVQSEVYTYDGTPKSLVADQPTGCTAVTQTFTGINDTVYGPTTTPPTDPGTYKVAVTYTMEAGYDQIQPQYANLTINKANQEAPLAPVVTDVTDTTITIEVEEGVAYSIDGGKTWQTNGLFTGLNRDTVYSIIPKAIETAYYKEQVGPATEQRTEQTVVQFPVIADQSYEFDGNAKTFVLPKSIPGISSMTIVSYGGLSTEPSAVGDYEVVIAFTPASGYKLPDEVPTPVLHIVKNSTPLSPVLKDETTTYDGTPQAYHGADNIQGITSVTITYVGSDGIPTTTPPTNAGSYEITADFTPDDGYTMAPGPFTATLIIKKAQQEAPIVDLEKSDATSLTATAIPGAEYSIDGGSNWQDSNVFENLDPCTSYTILVRMKGDENHEASATRPVVGTTTKHQVNLPEMQDYTTVYNGNGQAYPYTSTLTELDGVKTVEVMYFGTLTNGTPYSSAEAPVNAGTYSVRFYLTPETNYELESDTAEATMTIERASQTLSDAPSIANRTTTTIAVNPVPGAEYSIDGGRTWQDSPKFTGLTEGTDYTVMQRLAATDNYEASNATSTDTQTVEDTGLNYTINYKDETIHFDEDVVRGGNDYAMTDKLEDGDTIVPGSTIYVGLIDDGTGNNGPVTIEILPERPATPDVTVNPYDYNMNSTADMEYSKDGGLTWEPCTEQMNVEDLQGETLLVRIAATEDSFHSESCTVEVPVRGTAPVLTINNDSERMDSTTSMEYYDGESWIPCLDNMSVSNMTGETILVRYSCDGTNPASNSATVVIPTRNALPGFSFDMENETLVADSTLGQVMQNETWTDVGTGYDVSDKCGQTLTIRAKFDDTHFASLPETITVPLRGEKPAPVIDKETATIPNLTGAEYSTDNGLSWNQVPGDGVLDVSDMAGETILIRKDNTDSTFASEPVEVDIYNYAEKPDVTLNTKDETINTTTEMDVSSDGIHWTQATEPLDVSTQDGTTIYIRNHGSEDEFPSEPVTITIPERRPAPDVTVDNRTETIQPTGGTEYSTDGGKTWQDASDPLKISDLTGETILIRQPATDDEFASSIATVIVPERPDGPVLVLDTENETVNTTTDMEYSTDGGNTWNPAPEPLDVSDLAGTEIQVRYPADDDTPASSITTVTVPERRPAPDVTLDTDTGIISPSTGLEYSDDGGETWKPCPDPFDVSDMAGEDIIIREPATGTDLPGEEVTIHIPEKNPTPDVALDYGNETINTTDDMEYSTDGGETWQPATEPLDVSDMTDKDIVIRVPGDDDHLASDEQVIHVPARPAAPAVGHTDETRYGREDGSLTGTTTDMEYRVSGGSWTKITGTSVTGLAPGTYEVRYSATDSSLASLTQTVVIEEGRRSSGGGGGGSSGGGSSSSSDYTVRFDSNGGSKVNSQTVDRNSTVKEPDDPTRDGYIFLGWYEDKDLENKYDFSDAVKKNMTLYAKWEKVQDIPEDKTWMLNKEDHIAYIAGRTADTAAPRANITRGEVAMILYRLLTDEARAQYETNYCTFSDVESGAWNYTAIATLANAGVLAGYSDGRFGPHDNITRAQLATILARFCNETGTTGSDMFTDISGHWARNYINTAAKAGLVQGYGNGTFGPDNLITRAETVVMINRILERKASADTVVPGYKVFSDISEADWFYWDIIEASNEHDYDKSSGTEYWTELN